MGIPGSPLRRRPGMTSAPAPYAQHGAPVYGRWHRIARAREFVRKIVVDAPPESLEIGIEDESIAGRFAVLEITAIPLIGPRLPLAPEADPSDRDLDICFVGDNEAERQGFARWLDDPDSKEAVPASSRRA